MRRSVTLARQEVRGNWARNLVKGAILLCAIGTQLFTSLAAAASEQAVSTYGAAVFGYEQTYRADLEQPPSLAQLEAMDTALHAEALAHPWAVVVLQVGATAALTSTEAPARGPETTTSLASFHGPWTEVSATMSRSTAFREVSGPRAPPRLVVSGPLAERLGVSPTTLVTVSPAGLSASASDTDGAAADGAATSGSDDGPATPGAVSADPDTEPGATTGTTDFGAATGTTDFGAANPTQTPRALPDIPAHRGPREQNKALVNEVLASRSVLHLMGVAPDSASLWWRCAAAECPDVAGVAQDIARTVGLRAAAAVRVDAHDSLVPLLRQQREQGALFAWVALALGGVAVAVVATAMVEVRTPELVTLRTLGATRSTLFAAALLEGLVVAMAVGVLSMVASLVLAQVDPDLFNHIEAVRLREFSPPVGVYARTGATTVLVGLLTGLLPALRAHRLVRAN